MGNKELLNKFYGFSKAGIAALALSASISACGGGSDGGSADGGEGMTTFEVRIENIGADAITTSLGSTLPAVFAPGAASVNLPGVNAFFSNGGVATPGLEIMAEDGGGMLLAQEGSALEGVFSTVALSLIHI